MTSDRDGQRRRAGTLWMIAETSTSWFIHPAPLESKNLVIVCPVCLNKVGWGPERLSC
jgi:hypothetical protein